MSAELNGGRRGSKRWWRRAKQLLEQKERRESVPALRDAALGWVYAEGKANLLAKAFPA